MRWSLETNFPWQTMLLELRLPQESCWLAGSSWTMCWEGGLGTRCNSQVPIPDLTPRYPPRCPVPMLPTEPRCSCLPTTPHHHRTGLAAGSLERTSRETFQFTNQYDLSPALSSSTQLPAMNQVGVRHGQDGYESGPGVWPYLIHI